MCERVTPFVKQIEPPKFKRDQDRCPTPRMQGTGPEAGGSLWAVGPAAALPGLALRRAACQLRDFGQVP